MKVTDLIAKVLKKNNINCAFGLQGGAVVHIFDSFIKNKINITYTHHEESAALAAVASAKTKNQTGCAVVTTGPGTTNAITGLLAAWQDSVPVLFKNCKIWKTRAGLVRYCTRNSVARY